MTRSHIKGGGGFIFTKNWLTGNQEKHVKVALYIFISEIQKLRKKMKFGGFLTGALMVKIDTDETTPRK